MAGRPAKAVLFDELFRYHLANVQNPEMKVRPDCSREWRPSEPDRRATLWFMHQFDVVVMHQAFLGEKPSRIRHYHRPETWDLYRIIRSYIEILDNNDKDETGRPIVSVRDKVVALDKLREFHRIGASLHREFLLATTSGGDNKAMVSGGEVNFQDPLLLKMAKGGK